MLATALYVPNDFVPIAVINRFDLADPAGAHCGQYSLISANRNTTYEEVFHVIFEPVLPNPRPQLGVEGCRGVRESRLVLLRAMGFPLNDWTFYEVFGLVRPLRDRTADLLPLPRRPDRQCGVQVLLIEASVNRRVAFMLRSSWRRCSPR